MYDGGSEGRLVGLLTFSRTHLPPSGSSLYHLKRESHSVRERRTAGVVESRLGGAPICMITHRDLSRSPAELLSQWEIWAPAPRDWSVTNPTGAALGLKLMPVYRH